MRKLFIILSALSILVGCSREQNQEIINKREDSPKQKEDSPKQKEDSPKQKEDSSAKEKEGWKLVWEDDFNRDDIFSTGIWSKIWGCPTSTADWCKTMNHDPSLFEIKDGKMILLGVTNKNLKYHRRGDHSRKEVFREGTLGDPL